MFPPVYCRGMKRAANPSRHQGPAPTRRQAPSAEAADAAAFVNGYLAYLLARASHLISGEFHIELARRRLPIMHWRIMAALYDQPGLSLKELSDIVLTKQPTVSKIVSRMLEQGLLDRKLDENDRRGVKLSLSARGRKAAAPLIVAARQHEDLVLAPFGKANAQVLISTLQRLIRMHAQ